VAWPAREICFSKMLYEVALGCQWVWGVTTTSRYGSVDAGFTIPKSSASSNSCERDSASEVHDWPASEMTLSLVGLAGDVG
jgi:hypothetical protein